MPTLPPAHPNLILVYPDQWRGQALGFLHEEPVLTPHLDRFAGGGVMTRHDASRRVTTRRDDRRRRLEPVRAGSGILRCRRLGDGS